MSRKASNEGKRRVGSSVYAYRIRQTGWRDSSGSYALSLVVRRPWVGSKFGSYDFSLNQGHEFKYVEGSKAEMEKLRDDLIVFWGLTPDSLEKHPIEVVPCYEEKWI